MATITVAHDGPAHLRGEPLRVLSTPDMIRLIERTAIEALHPYLAGPGHRRHARPRQVGHVDAVPTVAWPGVRYGCTASMAVRSMRRIMSGVDSTRSGSPRR